MLVSDFESVFKALETNSVLGGLSHLQIIQQALDDIYADDTGIRLLRPAPFATTTDTQTEYTFEEILPTYVDGDGVTTIRRIKGFWDPTLSPTGPDVTDDYGRRPIGGFNQKDIDNRVYDGDIYVDNERKTVVFKSNPGTTTDKWNCDLYLDAPQIEEDDQIPLLKGWERRLLLPGVRAWFEELDNGEPGKQERIFNKQKRKYRVALNAEKHASTNTEDLGFRIGEPLVAPQ